MKILFRLFLYSVAVMITAWLLPGIHVLNYWTALAVAVLLAVLNTFLRPIMVFLTIPVTIITFGFFLLVINALIIILASKIVPGFVVEGFWWALLFSIILSIIAAIFGFKSSTVIFPKKEE
jgi:putative membrane protein